MLKIKKDSRGHRKYTPKDVDNLRLIYHLVKEQGMTLEGARKRMRSNPEGVSHDAEIVERLKNIRNMLAALKAEMGVDTEVIEIEEDIEVEVEPVVVAPASVDANEVVEESVVEVEAAEPAPAAKPAEELAEFQLESQPKPSVEEPHKKSSRGAKVGTLIGGNLFSPEDIRLAVAKKNSKEAKSQVIEQTLF